MSDYGFEGIMPINSKFRSMYMVKTGQQAFRNNEAFIPAEVGDVIVVSECNGDVILLRAEDNKMVVFSPNASFIRYMVFNELLQNLSGEAYGLQIFNEEGKKYLIQGVNA